ncbi:antibiotic biosynthesis monooxygenase [Deinococcus maricopensis]|uniref:Antibiotic biosynthesis monooxygenase n=1 Tax=Deinococcus maricopensis (strain DSM 21211 / LMG 22137 / NRRL B-23946 / LB-34) TaxID=709986 RepID=E8UBC3_DEIML|nr:antibiotic biosynthesis monooxygenase [Deinococcus maricopensis]ADV68362.1 Antibiotic biosynthesis monooxygenase [Deinococcus maricopensis DSM 21211]
MTETERDPVTIVVRRRVRPGRVEAFETMITELILLLSRAPGHVGTGVIRPQTPDGEYTLVVRFDNVRHAADWETSTTRAEWLERLHPLLDGETRIEHQPGLEFWFTPPSAPALRQPPRWKMVVLTVAALYPLQLLLNLLIGAQLAHLPLAVRLLILAVAVVMLMTYVVMPRITHAARRWLAH